MRRVWETLKALRRAWLAVATAMPLAPAAADVVEALTVSLGDRAVRLERTRLGGGGRRYVNVHENESTSVEAARSVLRERGGELVVLRAGGQRLVAFRQGPRPCAFDPNRIFTDAGLAATLQRHGCDTPEARAAAGRLRDALLQWLDGPPDEPVIALHNNAGGAYTVRAYLPGGARSSDAADVALGAAQAQEDFFVVTRRVHFERLRAAGFNVVLESEHAADDGSLSVWFHRQGRAYVNVEARHGHLDGQRRMLIAAADLPP